MKRTLRWLWAVYWARRYTRTVLFTERERFLMALRPAIGGSPSRNTSNLVAYPDAWLHITPADVRRAQREPTDA